MEISEFEIKEDIVTICVKAASFPAGIKDAYDKLHRLVGSDKPRQLYGISKMSAGNIVYYAGVNKMSGDDTFGLDEYIIPKGKYLATLFKWEGNEHEFGRIFNELMQQPGVKPGTIGVEQYYVTPDEARLMVQLAGTL
ncbi:GyrI-like domain-containing protein [Mucilaginibacter hurinus]|nr:GyrI-like domain-containing protein [Mucilaginibacter hurinus]